MKTRFLACLNVLLLAVLSLVLVPSMAFAGDEDPATEDVIHMADGRELHGQILEEKRDAIIFQFVDRRTGISTKLTLLREEIDRIQRDLPLGDAAAEQAAQRRPASPAPEEEPKQTYGARRVTSDAEDVPTFYVVPMKGQMGTDVNDHVYQAMIDDIREQDPDYLIIVMECLDEEERLYSRVLEEDQGLHGSTALDMYREVINVFHDELRDVRQVLWIHDSLGISSIVALSWSEFYMMPNARLGGLAPAAANFLQAAGDANKLGKYREAYMAWLKGFVENSEHDLELVDAMVRPEFTLSATWKGREVEWRLDGIGEYVVDDDDDETVTFKAKAAEDFCVSAGTAETFDDLALLLGIREYRVLESEAEQLHEDYREDWRRALETCKTAWEDYAKYLQWASGQDTLKYLGRAKQSVEKMISLMERYDAVELRVGMELGLRKFDLVTIVERLKEQIRALRQGRRGRIGGRGAPGGGAGTGG